MEPQLVAMLPVLAVSPDSAEMESTMMEFILDIGFFHWLALALILLGIEVMAGTFDLLWVAVAGFITALFALIAPAPVEALHFQILVFAMASIGLIIAGRTVFSGMRIRLGDRPTLNKRMDSMVGARGVAVKAFSSGTGRVKIGDTEWSAEFAEGVEAIEEGQAIIVEGARSTTVLVKPAG